MSLTNTLIRISETSGLDKPAGAVRRTVRKTLRFRGLRDTLHGVWLGHPLHPALVQLPIGAFASSSILDVATIGGTGHARDSLRYSALLSGVGIGASLPAALAGLADFAYSRNEAQRTGLFHASANTAALGCYGASVAYKLRGHQVGGTATGLAGLALTTLGSLIGGHMSFHQSTGPNQTTVEPHLAPQQWTDLVPANELRADTPTSGTLGPVPVVMIRQGEQVHVLIDRCTHATAPLSNGTLLHTDGNDACLQCPWHFSVFRLRDGAVVHGPATAPQPRFESRIHDGTVQARLQA